MPSKDYDDLLESFMNNSAKVYNEDKETLQSEENKVPSAYNIDDAGAKESKSFERGRIIEKRKTKKAAKETKEKKFVRFRLFRALMGICLVIGVVAVVCISVMGI